MPLHDSNKAIRKQRHTYFNRANLGLVIDTHVSIRCYDSEAAAITPVAPVIGPYSPLTGTTGLAFATWPAITAGTAPITFSFTGTPPPGTTFNTLTGCFDGIPTLAGSYPVVVTASNGTLPNGTTSPTFVISDPVGGGGGGTPVIYYGRHVSDDATFSEILSLTPLVTPTFSGSYSYGTGASSYYYLAIPTSLGVPTSIKQGSFDFALNDQAPYTSGTAPRTYKTLTISGTPYNVFRSFNPLVGALTLTVS